MVADLISAVLLSTAPLSVQSDPCAVPSTAADENGNGVYHYVQFGAAQGGLFLSGTADRYTLSLSATEMWFKNPNVRFGLRQAVRLAPDREALVGVRVARLFSWLEPALEAHYGFNTAGGVLPNHRLYLGASIGADVLTIGAARLRLLVPTEGNGTALELELAARLAFLGRLIRGDQQPAGSTAFEDPKEAWNAAGRILAALLPKVGGLDDTRRAAVYRIACEAVPQHTVSTTYLLAVGNAVETLSQCPQCQAIGAEIIRFTTVSDYVSLGLECVAYAIERSLYQDKKTAHACRWT
jgi:hypothetical protein